MSYPKIGEIRIKTQKQIGEEKKATISHVESIVIPIILDECKKLGIAPPLLLWVTSITISGEEMRGAYQFGTQTIYISHYTITQMLELNKTRLEIIARLVNVCFHELKHYIDDKYYKVSIQEIEQNYWKYDNEAIKYADELGKRVK